MLKRLRLHTMLMGLDHERPDVVVQQKRGISCVSGQSQFWIKF